MTRGEKYEATHSTSALMLQARRLCFHVQGGGHTEQLLKGLLASLLFLQVPELVFSLLFREHLSICHQHQTFFEELKAK